MRFLTGIAWKWYTSQADWYNTGSSCGLIKSSACRWGAEAQVKGMPWILMRCHLNCHGKLTIVAESSTSAPVLFHGCQVSWLLYYNYCIFTCTNCCHLRWLLDGSLPADWRKSPVDGGMLISKEVDKCNNISSHMFSYHRSADQKSNYALVAWISSLHQYCDV